MSRVTYVIHLYFIPFTLSSAGNAAASGKLRALKGGPPQHNCENRNDFNFPACDFNAGPNTDGMNPDEGDTCQPCCECNCGGPNDKQKCMKLLSNGDTVGVDEVTCEHYGGNFETYDVTTYGTAGCAAQCAVSCGP